MLQIQICLDEYVKYVLMLQIQIRLDTRQIRLDDRKWSLSPY